jgi:hypothetical protein
LDAKWVICPGKCLKEVFRRKKNVISLLVLPVPCCASSIITGIEKLISAHPSKAESRFTRQNKLPHRQQHAREGFLLPLGKWCKNHQVTTTVRSNRERG